MGKDRKPKGAQIHTERKVDFIKLSTLQIIKGLIVDKFWKRQDLVLNETPENITVHHLAVILDGKVYEVIRAQDKLADMFLAQPEFVLFDPATEAVHVGVDYVDGKFVHAEQSSTSTTSE